MFDLGLDGANHSDWNKTKIDVQIFRHLKESCDCNHSPQEKAANINRALTLNTIAHSGFNQVEPGGGSAHTPSASDARRDIHLHPELVYLNDTTAKPKVLRGNSTSLDIPGSRAMRNSLVTMRIGTPLIRANPLGSLTSLGPTLYRVKSINCSKSTGHI
jgi:hypothetical protein